YSKGQALIRMIEDYVGEAAFRQGIRSYTAEHAYGNATTADLWRALEAASGRPVAAIAKSFTEQAGVPLVLAGAACQGEQQRLRLQQERFTIGRSGEAGATWQLPVTLTLLPELHSATTMVLGERADISAGTCGQAVKLNVGDV